MRGVFPSLGGLMLTVAFVYGLISYAKPDWLVDDNGNNVTIFGIGAVAVVGIGGTGPGRGPDGHLVGHGARLLPRRTLPRARRPGARKPAAARGRRPSDCPTPASMPTVIAPDLSNLPEGETAIDPLTGEEFTKR